MTVLMKSSPVMTYKYNMNSLCVIRFHSCVSFLQLWWDVQHYWRQSQNCILRTWATVFTLDTTHRNYCLWVILVQPYVVTFLRRFTVAHIWGVFVEPSRFKLKTGTAAGQLTWPKAHSICWKDHGVSSAAWLLFATLYHTDTSMDCFITRWKIGSL